ncbi:MAG: hypothetical protein ACOYM9_09275 [Bradymonadia bacterium]
MQIVVGMNTPNTQSSLLALAVATALVPLGPAHADEGGGTANHFLFETAAGVAVPVGRENEVGPGYGGQATFGVGGRIPGTAPAWYLVLRVGGDRLEELGPARTGSAEIARGAFEWGFAGRVYVPVFGPRLRLVVEAGAGERLETARVERDGHAGIEFDTERFALFGATGLQLRLTEHLSLGGLVDLAWMPAQVGEDLAALAAGDRAADESAGRVRGLFTFTTHF